MLAKLLISCLLAGGMAAGLFVASAEAGLRDRDRARDRARPAERAVRVPGKQGALDPRGVADPRGEADPRSDHLDDNRDARRDTFEKNAGNREDVRGEGEDERKDAFENNQDNRQDTFDEASEKREQGREEFADEAEDIADDYRDGDDLIDDDPEFRGDGDGLIDGDGYESGDNDLLKVMVMGSMVRSLPANAQPQTVNSTQYYTNGDTWYQPVPTPTGTQYRVVQAPGD